MNHLDDELRLALRREDPPPDFAERVLDRLDAERRASESPARSRRSPLYGLAAAAALALMALAGLWVASLLSNGRKAAGPPVAEAPPSVSEEGNKVTNRHEQPDDEPHKSAAAPPRSPSLHRVARRGERSRAPQAGRQAVSDLSAAQAEAAREQLMLALRIAGAKLNMAQRKIQEGTREPRS